ncbi:malate synthase A [Hyphomonas pacifica]|uniref:malate synthase A n=1 Tax=Hyphomonas pacifica TaxID=1280941 RepID=UPI000DBFCA99|nr:malate synthase A [Hyphomonas pacifica]RAN34397.1 malate synthase [Hyphomonas pacifica]
MSATAILEKPSSQANSVEIAGNAEGVERVLTPEALAFLADLERTFGPRRRELLAARIARQARFDAGELPDFLPQTKNIRNGCWEVDPIPAVLKDRRVEITGPVDRKMMINALNSGAKMFMADFEDASSPTFTNMIEGQVNMQDFANGELAYSDPKNGKSYSLKDEIAVMIVRPRGWHMEEAHLLIDGRPISASLFDFGLHIFHNGAKLTGQGVGPFYYLPKMESHLEARLWDEVFEHAQKALGIPVGTIKATVLIETLPAAFEMDEILYELRRHAAGLNCGRWDYIFSYIKTLRQHAQYVLPDRAQVGMDRAFLKAYSLLLIKTCHSRRAHAMGGMAAQIPVKNDEAANDAAFAKVKADKLREVRAGHDGTWVAHPALVPVAMDVFNQHMTACNQVLSQRSFPPISQKDLLKPHTGEITEVGVRTNISVGIEYTAAWLNGRGAVPIHNLMEDAATAEISRSQIWQWIHHKADVKIESGEAKQFTAQWFRSILDEELTAIREMIGAESYEQGRYELAAEIFSETATGKDLPDFLTLPAYEALRSLD